MTSLKLVLRPPANGGVVETADLAADALVSGVDTTGVTIHLVDEGLDTGAVLRQEALSLEPRATLERRIHALEHRLLPTVVREMMAECRAR